MEDSRAKSFINAESTLIKNDIFEEMEGANERKFPRTRRSTQPRKTISIYNTFKFSTGELYELEAKENIHGILRRNEEEYRFDGDLDEGEGVQFLHMEIDKFKLFPNIFYAKYQSMTKRRLIQAITSPVYIDKQLSDIITPNSDSAMKELQQIVLYTYPNYITPYKLLLLLIERFLLPLPLNTSPSEFILIRNQHELILIKVIQFMQLWITQRKYDFSDLRLKILFYQFFKLVLATQYLQNTFGQYILQNILPLLGDGGDIDIGEHNNNKSDISEVDMNISSSQITLNELIYGNKLLEFSVEAIGSQLCLLDEYYFSQIKPTDFLKSKFLSENKRKLQRSNILRLIDRHNKLTCFWICYVVKEFKESRRIGLILHYIDLAVVCYTKYNNLNSAYVIYCSILTHLSSLKNSWKVAKTQRTRELKLLEEIFATDNNFRNMREYMKNVGRVPCVPCCYLWSKDIQSIEEAFPNDFIPKNTQSLHNKGGKMINLLRQTALADKLRDINKYSEIKYKLHRIPVLYDFLDKDYEIILKAFGGENIHTVVNKLYQIIYELE